MFKHKKLIFMSMIIILLLFILLTADYLVPNNPYLQNLDISLQSPSIKYPFGTDRFGRCLLSRVLVGGKTTIVYALSLLSIITIIGTIIGLFAGYSNRYIDTLLMRITDIFLSFPPLVFAIAIAGILGGGMKSASIALALVSWPKYARLARSQVVSLKQQTFIQAAYIGGNSWYKIVFKHIMPNMINIIITTAILDIGVIICELAGLSFLGLGALPPIAEWGSMMNDGRSLLQSAPWLVFAPGIAIFITVTIFNLFGDILRDLLDPTYQERKNDL